MKKVIGTKVYNTETSELILTLNNGLRRSQRDYYKTKKGAFFVHYVDINDIELVPELSMAELLMKYDVDKYIELFGAVEEG